MEIKEEQMEEVYSIIEVAKATGKIKKGTNEVTKAIEREKAVLVAIAKDASPAEIVMHIGPLADEKKVPYTVVASKEELGTAAGLPVATIAVAVVDAGEAKDRIKALIESNK